MKATWEKAIKEHNKNFLQIPYKFFRFSKNDVVVILLAEILDEFLCERQKGFVFLSFSDLEKRHEFETRGKLVTALKILKHRKILNSFKVLTKFGNDGDTIRVDVNEQNFKAILTNKKSFGRKKENELK